MRHETDVKVVHKVEAFNRIKGKDVPPFHQIVNEVEDLGIVVPLERLNTWNIFVDQPQRFQTLHHIQINDKQAIVTAIGSDSIYVEFACDITFVNMKRFI